MSKDNKKKSILIDGELHNEFKNLTSSKNYKMGGVVEDLIKDFIGKNKDKEGKNEDGKES